MCSKENLNKLVGFGDLENAKYIFLGYEEKGNDYIEEKRCNRYKSLCKNSNDYFYFTNEDLYKDGEEDSLFQNDKEHSRKNKTYSRYKRIYNDIKEDCYNICENFEIGSKCFPLFVGNIYPFAKQKHSTSELDEERINVLSAFFSDIEKRIKVRKVKKVLIFILSEIKNGNEKLKDLLKQNDIKFDFDSVNDNEKKYLHFRNANQQDYYLFYHPTSSQMTHDDLVRIVREEPDSKKYK